MQTHSKLFIGGEWVAPSTAATIDVISPHTEEVIARVAAAARGGRRPRRRRGARGVRRGPVAAHVARPSAPTSWRALLAALQERSAEMATTITDGDGLADLVLATWAR